MKWSTVWIYICIQLFFFFIESSGSPPLTDKMKRMKTYLWCDTWKGRSETDSGYLRWLGMWLHGAASNLCWGGQTAWGLNCGSWYVSKNRHPPPPPPPPLPSPTNPLFFIADADCCLFFFFTRKQLLSQRKSTPSFNKLASSHLMTDSLTGWLTCWREMKSEKACRWHRAH